MIEARMLSRLEQAEILRQVKNLLAVQRRNRTWVLSSRMTEESEKQSNAKALENFADFLKEL
jgi:ribosomal protein L18E